MTIGKLRDLLSEYPQDATVLLQRQAGPNQPQTDGHQTLLSEDGQSVVISPLFCIPCGESAVIA